MNNCSSQLSSPSTLAKYSKKSGWTSGSSFIDLLFLDQFLHLDRSHGNVLQGTEEFPVLPCHEIPSAVLQPMVIGFIKQRERQ